MWEPPCDRSGKSGLWIDDPVAVAMIICEHDNGLLDEPGWKLPGLKEDCQDPKEANSHGEQG